MCICVRYEFSLKNIENQQYRLIDSQDACIVRDEK